ncbi:MAG: phage tail protein [Gammaproteobacteria bacterium]|nr:phage tail protein [Gammaproteobacteria bacterium]MCF6260306.1 phage tail protein [Gammaproteobacteria bacterium]
MVFGSSSSVGGYPPSAFYFKVVFATTLGFADTSFQEVSGIGSEMETEDLSEGGENRFVHRLPKSLKHPRLVLKRGVAEIYSPLVIWCRSVLEGQFIEPIKPTTIVVSLMNEVGMPMRTWSFVNAFPVSWEVEAFNSTKNEVAIEKIELSYNYFDRVV